MWKEDCEFHTFSKVSLHFLVLSQFLMQEATRSFSIAHRWDASPLEILISNLLNVRDILGNTGLKSWQYGPSEVISVQK